MIIIATDTEKMKLEKNCSGECEHCLLGFANDTGDCPIDIQKIVVVDKYPATDVLYREE